VKLTPNVTDIRVLARAVADAGADALTLINTLQGMAIDVETRRPALARVVGGLSGPAIRPVAVRMVWQVRQALAIPVVGCGGVWTARDAIEFLLAGATAVQLGTVNFTHPGRWVEVVDGIRDYLRRHNIPRAADLVGALET
jgi:dihydroorotate dehydrogenase (NAD+) catalytic subunit